MAFEQFFYDGDVKITVGGESHDYRVEILPDGTPIGYGARCFPCAFGGINIGGIVPPSLVCPYSVEDAGAILGGVADVQVTYATNASGGFNRRWPSGKNIENNIFSVLVVQTENPESGVLISGSLTPNFIFCQEDSGGAALGGEAGVQLIHTTTVSSAGFSSRWPSGSGSNIEDDIFSIYGIITEIPKGGILSGGEASPKLRFNPDANGTIFASGHGFSTEERFATGGAFIAGAAFVSEKDEEIGSGGIVVGGQNFWFGHVGGINLGGAATVGVGIVGAGGVKSGGAVSEISIYDPPIVGGGLLHGDARNIENITVSGGAILGGINSNAESSSGGSLLGGSAFTTYDEVGIVGVVTGGISPNGTHDFGSGGALAGGTILQQITQHIDVSGVLISGKAPEEPPISGGAVFGGFGVQTFDQVADDGGVVLGGRAIVKITPSVGNGSTLLGGRLIVGIEPGVSGGAVLGGFGVQTFDESGIGGGLVGGQGLDTQTAYHYISDGDFVQVTQPDPNIYKITTKHYNYEMTGGVTVVGNGFAGRRFFGQSIPSFSFGKISVKNEACRSFRDTIRQPTVLSMTRTKTREWLEKLDPEDWSVTSFDPKKREVCILVEAGHGITHLITAELLLMDSGVGSP
jgi:hypothetical protein